jgi:hypothetical protein
VPTTFWRRAVPAAAATALEMGLLMAYWELMSRYYDRNGGVNRNDARHRSRVTRGSTGLDYFFRVSSAVYFTRLNQGD